MHEEQKPGNQESLFPGPPRIPAANTFSLTIRPLLHCAQHDRGCIIHQGDVPAHGSGVPLRSFVSIWTIIVTIITTIIGMMIVRRSL